jgi:hypothetical protein
LHNLFLIKLKNLVYFLRDNENSTYLAKIFS